MKDRLYLEDAFREETISRIKSKINEGDNYLISFAETIFYPGGGGQPADMGTIDGQEVVGIEERSGGIYHLLKNDPGKGPCRLNIDFERRFIFMQQHTAQHLLSQVLLRNFNSATLSFSLTEEHASIETDRNNFSEAETEQLEIDCNQFIFSNLEVRSHLIQDENNLPLRKPAKVSGPIRVIEIDSFDYSACGGTHLRSTGQIGLLKITGLDRVRGHSRLYFLAGKRALYDYQRKSNLVSQLQQVLSVTPEYFASSARSLKEDREKLQRENRDLKSSALNQKISVSRLAGERFFSLELPGLEAAEIKQLATRALVQGIGICLFTTSPKPYLLVGDGSETHDLREVAETLFGLLGGRGGGRKQLIEGSVSEPGRIPEVLDLLQDLFSGK